MQSWVGKKPLIVDDEFGALIRSNEQRKQLKKQKQRKKAEIPIFYHGFVDNTTKPQTDFNFECGCFGTTHNVLNNCTSCGRIICTREGERPCPYCGTLVFSDETLNDPDLLEEKKKEMQEKIGSMKWIPIKERDLKLSHQPEEISTAMIDLDVDWFDSELNQIFTDENQTEENQTNENQTDK